MAGDIAAPLRRPWAARWPGRRSAAPAILLLLAVLAAGRATELPDWATSWPAEWIVPLKDWLTAGFAWLAQDLDFGPFTFRELTRSVSWLLSWPLGAAESLLFKGFTRVGLPPLPWLAVVIGAGLLGHALGGWRLASLAAGGTFYLALFNVWADSMRTLSLVVITVPIAAAIGFLLGVLAIGSRRIEIALTAIFDVMQATPHLAYLAPVAVFFGFGPVPALVATAIFAIPPMARCTLLGLQTVGVEVLEAGLMSGCTPRQLLWRVRIPAGRPAILVGLNQVIMQTLAMAVIASLIGATGLGHRLLFSLQQLQMGKAIEYGLAIVIIAVVLDRLSQAFAARATTLAPRAAGAMLHRHRHLLLFVLALSITLPFSYALPELRQLPRSLTITTAPFWDQFIRWLSRTLFDDLAILRDDLTVHVLIPLRNAMLSLPWSAAVVAMGSIGMLIGGPRLAILAMGLLLFIAATGFWQPAMMTVYLTSIAVLICMAIGTPLGIWAAHRPQVGKIVLLVCDTLQTFPSFIYLIPVIMLFRVGDLASLVAIIGYASVPAIRYTWFGITRVPPATVEAARAAGASRWQVLAHVELPLAVPEIMLGLNQTIIMALFMTSITALIGSRDLGQEILKALPEVDTGRGLLAGLCIAALGILANRLIGVWVQGRKRELGLT